MKLTETIKLNKCGTWVVRPDLPYPRKDLTERLHGPQVQYPCSTLRQAVF